MKEITGIVKSVIYSDRRFAIISVITDDDNDWIISGDFSGSIYPGMAISCKVTSHDHPLYGERYQLLERDVPDDHSRHLSAIWSYLSNHDQMRKQASSIVTMLMDEADPLQQIINSDVLGGLTTQIQAQITMELSASITLAEMGMDWVIPITMSILGPSAPTQVISAPGVLLGCHVPWRDVYGLAMRLCNQAYVDDLIRTAVQTQMLARCQMEISEEDLAHELKTLGGQNITCGDAGLTKRNGMYVPWRVLRSCSILENTLHVYDTKTLFWPGDIDNVAMEAARKILSIINISNLCVVDTQEAPKTLIKAIISFLSSHGVSTSVKSRRSVDYEHEKITIICDAHMISTDRLITQCSERTIVFGDSLLSLAGDGGFGLLWRGCDQDHAVSLDDPAKRLKEMSTTRGWKDGAPVIRRTVSMSAKNSGYLGADYGSFRLGDAVKVTDSEQSYVYAICEETGVEGVIPEHFLCDAMSIALTHLIGMKLDYANLGFRPKSLMELYMVCANVKKVYTKYPVEKNLPAMVPTTRANIRYR